MPSDKSYAEFYFGVPLGKVSESHLYSLVVERKVEESLTLEYKSFETLRKSNRDKLGQAVSALANSLGGLLIIGVKDGQIDWGNASDYQKDVVEDIVLSKIQPRPPLNCQQVRNSSDPNRVVYVVEVGESDRPVMFDYSFYHRKGAKSLKMEFYEVEAAFNIRRRPYLEPKLYRYGSGKDRLFVYVCLFNTGRGAAHHPFFLGQIGEGIEIEAYDNFQKCGLRGGINSIQWLGGNIVIPAGAGIVMSELRFRMKSETASLSYFVGADGIEPQRGTIQLPKEISREPFDREIPILVSPGVSLT